MLKQIMFGKRNKLAGATDLNLVNFSLGGDREAFCQIVSRYQNLLCSVAYSSIGDLKQSEDIAQEAFVEAWRKLDTLREPEKLKAWLCAILRFKISNHCRGQANHPVTGAEELQDHHFDNIKTEEMDEVVIRQQHETLLWKALENIDPTYREPLILFYREQLSVELVAAELDLSVDTAKQRLSRGRKLLKRAMSSFVEDALQRSKPGVAFTAAVLVAIGGISPPTKAAGFGAASMKAGSFFNIATVLSLLATFSGLASSFFGLKAALEQSRTQAERQLVVVTVTQFISFAIIFVLSMFLLNKLALSAAGNVGIYALLSQLSVLAFVLTYLFLAKRMFAKMRALRVRERLFHPESFLAEAQHRDSKRREYKSRLNLCGFPLFHFQFGMSEQGDKPAVAWIASGPIARGVLFAWGGVAIAPISIGIVSVGIVTIGGIGFGILSVGTVALGIISFGASAFGFKAYASLSSLGWQGAWSNGFSIAKEAAIGPIALAEHVNNADAAALLQLVLFEKLYPFVLVTIAVLVIAPAVLHARKVRQRMR